MSPPLALTALLPRLVLLHPLLAPMLPLPVRLLLLYPAAEEIRRGRDQGTTQMKTGGQRGNQMPETGVKAWLETEMKEPSIQRNTEVKHPYGAMAYRPLIPLRSPVEVDF